MQMDSQKGSQAPLLGHRRRPAPRPSHWTWPPVRLKHVKKYRSIAERLFSRQEYKGVHKQKTARLQDLLIGNIQARGHLFGALFHADIRMEPPNLLQVGFTDLSPAASPRNSKDFVGILTAASVHVKPVPPEAPLHASETLSVWRCTFDGLCKASDTFAPAERGARQAAVRLC